MNPLSLTHRDQALINAYSTCQLEMTPQQFYAKWNISQEVMAAICSRSLSTVQRWFRQGRSYRQPNAADLRHLALMDFLLEYFEELPSNLRSYLCPDIASNFARS